MRSFHPERLQDHDAFTVLEMLVSIVVLAVILVVFSQILGQTSSAWTKSTSKIGEFREARASFDLVVNRLSEATVDSYNGYQYAAGSGQPTNFYRRSDLRFISGPGSTVSGTSSDLTDAVFFLAPLGKVTDTADYGHLPGLLNICGYFVQWSNTDVDRPSILPGNGIYRFRLMQFVEPSEMMSLYSQTSNYPTYAAVTTSPSWQLSAMASAPASQIWTRPVADNVVALLLLPALSTTDTSGTLGFTYNSEIFTSASDPNNPQNRLPPVMRVVLYTIDEASAQKIGNAATMPNIYVSGGTPLFTDPTKLYPAANGGDVGDLQRFETGLTAAKLTFRRFETAIQFVRAPWKTLVP